ncbi:hypothetical protein B0H11DRAFT_2087745 [Mycena galericulata]|nr:hypothetical protein B0H11DRAFT_2087745 [Mycena galericulata]
MVYRRVWRVLVPTSCILTSRARASRLAAESKSARDAHTQSRAQRRRPQSNINHRETAWDLKDLRVRMRMSLRRRCASNFGIALVARD